MPWWAWALVMAGAVNLLMLLGLLMAGRRTDAQAFAVSCRSSASLREVVVHHWPGPERTLALVPRAAGDDGRPRLRLPSTRP
jgi:hypothetical protein